MEMMPLMNATSTLVRVSPSTSPDHEYSVQEVGGGREFGRVTAPQSGPFVARKNDDSERREFKHLVDAVKWLKGLA